MELLRQIGRILGWMLFLCYAYQLVYLAVPLFARKPRKENAPLHRFAVLIAARNEEAVIANLIESIQKQKYPGELADIFVVADNCTDRTAEIALAAGAEVFQRCSRQTGKGYALHYLLNRVSRERRLEDYDAFLVLDADNVLDEQYLAEMNRVYSQGYRIVTSYRNSKNYADNWLSAGYALWFLRESRYLNHARALLGTSCAVSGTGFLVDRQLLQENGGWTWYLLTEDLEFTACQVAKGEKVGFAADAVLYDEQPTGFLQSWHQRMRWAKGNLQVFCSYGPRLLRGLLTRGGFACFDMLMATMPAVLVSFAGTLVSLAGLILALCSGADVLPLLGDMLFGLLRICGTFALMGGITVITEWKRIYVPGWKKVMSVCTFPLFMLTYLPISIAAIFARVTWKPVRHSRNVSAEEIRQERYSTK